MKNHFEHCIYLGIVFISLFACKVDNKEAIANLEQQKIDKIIDTNIENQSEKQVELKDYTSHIDDRNFIELGNYNGFKLDIRYATTNNFTKKQIYDCPRCLLRKDAANALILLNNHLKTNYGLQLKMFDCYRPRPYQQKLWDIVPNPDYVTPPAKGSMHNRGLAVDLTLIDSLGREQEMGTAYDFFGKEAHYDYTDLPAKVLEARKFLRTKMEAYGFEGIRTEWWHFSYKGKQQPLSDYKWPCD